MRSDEQASLTGPLFTDYALLPDLGVGLDLAPSDRNTLIVPAGLGTCVFFTHCGAEDCSDLMYFPTVQASSAVTHGPKCSDGGYKQCKVYNFYVFLPLLHGTTIL